MTITTLIPSPTGELTHDAVRQKINEVINNLNIASLAFVGFADYNDNSTASSPINVPVNTPTVLTNDAAGSFTLEDYLPIGVSSVWDSVNNQFDFSELEIGDMLDIRFDASGVTTTPNQRVQVFLELAQGTGGTYSIQFIDTTVKSAGSYNMNRFNGIYIGNADTRDNPAQFKVTSDAAMTAIVNGWYVKVIRRGENVIGTV